MPYTAVVRLRNSGQHPLGINLTVVVLYVINAWLHTANPDQLTLPMFLSLVAILLLVVSGWLGGKLVYEHGVGVDTTGPATR